MKRISIHQYDLYTYVPILPIKINVEMILFKKFMSKTRETIFFKNL